MSEDSITKTTRDVFFQEGNSNLRVKTLQHSSVVGNKAENDELPNYGKTKYKASDYLNIARDYLATDSHTDAIHEDTEKEFPIWGIPPGKNSEELLYTKATSHSQAKKIAKVLSDKHGCKKVRIQVLDLAQNPADIFQSDKIFNK